MKTQKLIQSVFASGSARRTDSIIALVAGLAAGAAIGILFAPEGGKEARGKICDAVSGLLGIKTQEEKEEELSAAQQQRAYAVQIKKPKSDIKSILHQAHAQEAHTEQGIS